MPGHDLFQISKVLEDCLSKVKNLKSLNVRFQRYEQSAKLRDIEKQLESISEHLGPIIYTIPNKGLTPKGRLFYNELFHYCAANKWRDIPAIFQNLLTERKKQLNKQIEFDDEKCSFLLNLNKRLKGQEDTIKEFYNFIQYLLSIKGLKSLVGYIEPEKLSLKCFTQSSYYEFNPGSFNHEISFYEIEFSLTDLIESVSFYYDTTIPDAKFFNDLPLRFRDEEFCLLFAFLANDGILAWQDFLNISQIKIDLNVKYQFTG